MDQVLQNLNKDHDIIDMTNNDKFVIEPIFLAKLNLLQFFREVFAKPSSIKNNGKIKDFDQVPENLIGCQECAIELTHGFCKTLVVTSCIMK